MIWSKLFKIEIVEFKYFCHADYLKWNMNLVPVFEINKCL